MKYCNVILKNFYHLTPYKRMNLPLDNDGTGALTRRVTLRLISLIFIPTCLSKIESNCNEENNSNVWIVISNSPYPLRDLHHEMIFKAQPS